MNVDFVLHNQDWLDGLSAIIVFAVTAVVAVAARFLSHFVHTRLAARTRTQLDDLVLGRMTMPIVLAILVAGIYIGINRISALDPHMDDIIAYFIVGAIAVTTFALARFINAILAWYAVEIAHRTKTDLDEKLIPILSRVINVIVYAVGFMIILDRLEIEISPLIASLGIGGLAIALAVQPSLASFLAGTYVIADGIIKRGDYIELDSGQVGFVESIGWRTTKIRHWQGNLIILPNSKLADAVITDYEMPEPPMLFFVPCGVSYDSDLEKAEKVSLEVARQVIKDCPEAVHNFEPVFRWREFADSNVNFIVVFKGVNRVAQFIVRHHFIRELHKRFLQEGIEINYPARKLQFSNDLRVHLSDGDLRRMVQGNERG